MNCTCPTKKEGLFTLIDFDHPDFPDPQCPHHGRKRLHLVPPLTTQQETTP